VFFVLVAALASAAFAQGKDTDKNENLRDCLAGFSSCNRSLLTADQAQQLKALDTERNLWDCLTGTPCAIVRNYPQPKRSRLQTPITTGAFWPVRR
jgi:hypothetical protein